MADVFADLRDDSNPFAVAGISDEDRALLQYLRDAKAATRVDVVATCTTDHPAGNTRHLQQGTHGLGLAIDCRKRTRGLDVHRAVFDLFVPIEKRLYELIYAGVSYNIKAGKRVAPYAQAGHHDHVHVAVARGVFVRWPRHAPRPPIQEVDMHFRYTAPDNAGIWVTDGTEWKRAVAGEVLLRDLEHTTRNLDELVGGRVTQAFHDWLVTRP